MTPTSHSLTTGSNTNKIITVVFMVGYNMEWYAERCMYGDIALYYHWLLFFNHHHHHDNIHHDEIKEEKENKHPPTRIQFVHEYDMDDMTSTQLQERLSVFLDDVQDQYRGGGGSQLSSSSSNVRIQFVLYIGGHGESGYYCWTRRKNHHYTNSNDRNSNDDSDDDQYQECWYYKDIITLLRQKLLPTDIVYLLVDTCYSGSVLYEFDDCCAHDKTNNTNTNISANSNNNKDGTTSSIQLSKTQPEPPSLFPKWYTQIQNPNMEVSFMIFMSTKADCMAGPEWTLTQGWIEVMMGHSPSHHHHSTTPPSIREVVYTLRDKIDRIKHNEMQFLYVYSIHNDIDSSSSHIPSGGDMDTTVFPFIIPSSLSSVPITSPSSLLDDNSCIRFHNWRVIKEYKKSRNWWWNCFCPYRTKHGTNDHSTMMNYYYQMIAFRLLANNGQYRYYSNVDRGNSRPNGPSSDRANVLIPPNRDRYIVGAKVWCIWEDHTQLYLGTIMDDTNVSWEDFIPTNWTNDSRSHDLSTSELSMSLPNLDLCYGIGPCIPVQWDNEPSWSFLPIGQCYVVVPDDIQQQQQQKDPPKFHQVQELAYNTMRNVLRQQFVISSSGTIQRPLSIPMDCLLRNFHSMGKELYFTSHDIYHEILRSNDTERNGMISIQDFNDMDTLRFVPCPTIRHLLLEYLTQCDNHHTSNDNSKKNKNDNNHRNIDRGDDDYWITVTKQVRSIHDVMEDMLWTHVWYDNNNTTTTLASLSSSSLLYDGRHKYCIMKMKMTMNSLVDNDTNHHYDTVMDTVGSRNDHSIPWGYICVPIALLRIKESESEMRNREISNINDDNIQMNL